MEIKLDDLNFQEVFNAAIIKTLDEGKKDELIKGAISHLMDKSNSKYGNNKSPLQDAFETALYRKAISYIEEFLDKNTEIKEKIEGLIKDAIELISTKNREKTINNIANKIIEGLYSETY